ncbi:MAG: cation-efflux pump [Methanobacteriota archaeon]|nr:MAG: cation-efflux pump [Euryarchaeota archaeon]
MSLIPDYGDPSNPEVRAKYGYLESTVGLIGNSSLFAAKLVIGLLISSIALFGDSLNHLTDLGISLVLLFGFRLAKKEADKEHPFGHARAEGILSIVVATLVVAMGIAVLMASAQGLMAPMIRGSLTIAILVLVFALVKEAMARFAFAIASKIDSKALRADGWNHRFDAIISVVIAGGIYLSTLDAQLRIIDPVLGVVVAVFVMYTGFRLIKETGDELLGRTPSEDVLRAVREVASEVEGVEDAHDVLVHDYGTYKTMSLHVTVKESLTAGEAHDIASEVETAMKDKMNVESIVHIEPKQEAMDVKELERQIEEVISGYKEVLSSHNIRVEPHGRGGRIDMHILIDKHMNVEDAHKLVHDISSSISRRLPDHEANVHVEPCGGECKVCQEICSRGFEKEA